MNISNSLIKQEILLHKEQLAERIVDLQYKKQPEICNRFGPKGRAISIRDAGYHLPFLAEAIEFNDAQLFTDYVAWVKKLFAGLKIPDTVMEMTLQCTGEALAELLTNEQYTLCKEFIQAGISQMQEPVMKSTPYISEKTPHGPLAMKYSKALLEGNRKTAADLILKAVDNGMALKDIYLHVFQKSQYEIGRLWLENKISVAKEHFCSAATQQIMTLLYPYIFKTQRIGKKIVAASVGGELHEIGIRMVSDFFEMEGWDSYYLGANTPVKSIISSIHEYEAQVVALSIAISSHRSVLKNAVSEIRQAIGDKVKIMVGGAGLHSYSGKIYDFGADGTAFSADEAIELANQLMHK